jgi:hypothetical protein
VHLLKKENRRLDEQEREMLASGLPVDEAAVRFRYIL